MKQYAFLNFLVSAYKKMRELFFYRNACYFISLLAVFSVGCSEPSVIGLDVQPLTDRANVEYTDSVSLITSALLEDSIRTDETTLNLLGSYTDPIFGTSSATSYFQIRLPSNDIDFGTGPILDSVILSMAYNGYYGDTLATQNLYVYELSESFYKDSTYYSNKDFSYNSTPIGTLTFSPRPTDSVLVGSIKEAAQLRIRLSDSFGSNLLNAGTANLANNDAFLQFFKGLYIKTDEISSPNLGSILYFDLLSSLSRLTLYYNDTLSFHFIINTESARVNHFEHDYTGTNILNSSTYNATVYVQAMAGIKTKIELPYLSNFVDSGPIAVNKAELVVTVEEGTTDLYESPDKLLLIRVDSLGKNSSSPVPGDLTGEAPSAGVTYNSDTREYRFNIANHIQDILSGKVNDYGLFLLPAGAPVSANRAVIAGGQNINYRMKLQLTYTKLPNL